MSRFRVAALGALAATLVVCLGTLQPDAIAALSGLRALPSFLPSGPSPPPMPLPTTGRPPRVAQTAQAGAPGAARGGGLCADTACRAASGAQCTWTARPGVRLGATARLEKAYSDAAAAQRACLSSLSCLGVTCQHGRCLLRAGMRGLAAPVAAASPSFSHAAAMFA